MTFVPKENPNTEGVVAPNNKPRRTKPRFNYNVSVRKKTVIEETEKGKKKARATRETWFWSYTGDDENEVKREVQRDAERACSEMERQNRKINYTIESVELVETVPIPY